MCGWKGIRKIFDDYFDSGTDQDLASAGWKKVLGTAVIKEDGTSKAYSSSASFATAQYTPDAVLTGPVGTNWSWVSCDVHLNAHNGVLLEVYHSIYVSGGRRTGLWVEVTRNQTSGIWTFTYNLQFNGGAVTSTSIGTIDEATYTPPYTILIRKHGTKYDVDIGQPPIVGGDGLISLYDQGQTSWLNLGRPGIGYKGPFFGLGGHEAEWSDFIVRKHAK